MLHLDASAWNSKSQRITLRPFARGVGEKTRRNLPITIQERDLRVYIAYDHVSEILIDSKSCDIRIRGEGEREIKQELVARKKMKEKRNIAKAFPVRSLADIKYRVALLYAITGRSRLQSIAIFPIIVYEIREKEKLLGENLSERNALITLVFSFPSDYFTKDYLCVAYLRIGEGEGDINPFAVRCYDSNPPKCYGKSAGRELSSVTFETIIVHVSTCDIADIPDYCDAGIKLTDDCRARNKLDIPRLVNDAIRVL